MGTELSKTRTRIKVIISSSDNFLANIPKEIQLLDLRLNKVSSAWVLTNQTQLEDIPVGTYVVKLVISALREEQKIIELSGNDVEVTLEFQLDEKKNRNRRGQSLSRELFRQDNIEPSNLDLENHLLYVNDSISPLDVNRTSEDIENFREDYSFSSPEKKERKPRKTKQITLTLQRQRSGKMDEYVLQNLPFTRLNKEGTSISFETTDGLHALRIVSDFFPPKLIICQPAAKLTVRLRKQTGDNNDVHPVMADVYSNDWKTEGLLNLISKGAMADAISFATAELAQQLLHDKFDDPCAAAVGGYFLLKVRDFPRMHNWAANLANHFEWLPDGAIIHAWKLIGTEEESSTTFRDFRESLLRAWNRGMPLFTEGVRLLLDGLNQLSVLGEYKDNLVEQALSDLRKYTPYVDWNKKNTTIDSRLGFNQDTTMLLLPGSRNSRFDT